MHKTIEVYFVKDQKTYVDKFGKKSRSEYILNVNKIIKEKLQADFVIPNQVQSFLLNYEIRKIIDKVLNIKNKKYTKLIYLNYNLDISIANMALDFLQATYPSIQFSASILMEEDEVLSATNSTIKIVSI